MTGATLPTSVGVKILACFKRAVRMMEKFSATRHFLYLPQFFTTGHVESPTTNSVSIRANQ
jgi:hypothetical protein